MYIRRKVYSAIECEDGEVRLFSTTDVELNEEVMEQREYTWMDKAGNIWKGAEGDKSQGLAEVKGDLEGKISKGKYSKAEYKGGTGTNLKAAKELTEAEKKAIAKQNKEVIKAQKKVTAAKWKAEHSKENMKKVNTAVAAAKSKLAEAAANRKRIADKAAAVEKSRLIKKAGKIGGGIAAGAALAGGAAYGYKKVAAKKD